MKHTLFLAATVALVALGVGAQETPDNHQAQEGKRIGRVFIGDTRAAVVRRLGKPTRTFSMGHGLTSQLWKGKKPGDTGNRNTLEVVYRGSIVTQIEATSLIFKIGGALSLASTRREWEGEYGAPSVSTYSFEDGDTRKRYLDWKSDGLALELVCVPNDDGSPSDKWTYQTLIVHRKGAPVLPDRGGERE